MKDEMTKEGFIEKMDKKTFVLVPTTEKIGYNARWAFRNGEFVVEYQIENLGNNSGADSVRWSTNKLDNML